MNEDLSLAFLLVLMGFAEGELAGQRRFREIRTFTNRKYVHA